ncbi:ABC transporter ATP-binding protein [Falsochrobactrum sp. TDYN1]|uniref:ABC transporter ATP-binding protein n=1 Tax=Falsochrobactrum tianjinense TaxID=2706015 RepID=A0A949PMA5_9HYPH|nr:ABC transporter ATP-binding protein [Falsochrobactrum sp. TDYN1]MBV2143872.1 ABC transporter ATP-binding protein [Falsochrobactrum sp. TDYN1]
MSVLSVNGLNVSLGRKLVLSGIRFEARPGDFIGLIGPNGAGKTTLLRALLGRIQAEGEFSLNGHDLHRISSSDRARAIAYLPQERDVAWPVSVRTLVSFGRSALKPVFAGEDPADAALVEAAMERMDIGGFRDRPVNELSGGEKARVLIARVLAQDTPVILADEPIAGLDPAHQLALMDSFARLAKEGRTVIASLHELGLAAQYCTRLIVLDQGRIVADGVPESVLTSELLEKVYDIHAHLMNIDGEFIVHPKARISK